MRLYFVTPVWGRNHIGLFLEVGLPSLLAPGNLPGISKICECRFIIYTLPEDEQRLRDARVVRRLGSQMPVEFCLIGDPVSSAHRTMSDCHADTMRRADEDDAAAVFIPPDCIWADDGMMRLARIAQSGKSAVLMSGLRLDRDAVVPLLRDRRTENGEVLQITARPLVELGLRHLHKIALGHFWNEHGGGLMPANLYWTVPGEGLALRCYHLHPLLVKSQIPFARFASTIDDDLVREKAHRLEGNTGAADLHS